MPQPRLENILVVDFSWVRAGPWATRWLGALGAETSRSNVEIYCDELGLSRGEVAVLAENAVI